MKVAILGGYGPTQSIGALHRAFWRAGHQVTHWPTFDAFDKECYRGIKPDLLFTFKMGLTQVPRGWIASLDIPVKIFWSFDDPHWSNYHALLSERWWPTEHNIVFTSCAGSVKEYTVRGMRAHFMPPAMDLFYYNGNPRMTKHVTSFICTNFYPPRVYPDNFIDRSEMVDRLTATFGKDFALYGFTRDVEAKPACLGSVKWEDTLPQAIQETRMNINNHAYNKDYLYFNERFFQIASTRKAMFVDRVCGFTDLFGEKDDCFVWYSSLDELTEKLIRYNERTSDLVDIGQRGHDRMRNWTYDEMVKQVLIAADGGVPKPTFL